MTSWRPGWTVRAPSDQDTVVAIAGHSVLKPQAGWLHRWPAVRPAVVPDSVPLYLGQWSGEAVFVAEADPDRLPLALEPVALRDAFLSAEEAPAAMLSTAFQVHHWWRDHRFCGRCGEVTGLHPRERAKWCERCGIPWYPRLAPCVIVLVRRGDTLLLARSSRAKRYYYSLIAGFVEPGESIEDTVAREVREETGLEVANIRYQGSQHWPFPHQLMLGFFADYAGGELVLQQDELADAGWYAPGALPPTPPATTIAGQLIAAMEKEIAG